ncbi:MAG: hypothetical protein K2K21_00590 [Lachnospiraceae bacterium]|nr:hypothetical protein [Lachnospiraceae bacterium]
MKKITDRTIKGIFYGVGIAVLLGLSCVSGIYIEREHQKILELQREHVATIAVVNMDNGVIVDEKQINYASQLINFPNENFTATGLTDAKMGIENGTYAAYIIIPETFSASVTSIESAPRKTVLEYQYNPNLAETAQIQAMSDVNTFIATFNSNIAYMYVDAVLTEFHRIQDDSSTILANDNSELERLESVNAALLIQAAEHVEESSVDNNIQSVELTPYTAQNDSLLDSMLMRYMESVQLAQNDYAAIQETRSEVDTAAYNFFSTYNSVVYDTNAEQADILLEGKTNLIDAVGIYNQDVDEQREEVETLIADLIDKNERIANEQLNNIISEFDAEKVEILDALKDAAAEELEESLNNYQSNMENWLEGIVEDSYERGFQEGLSVSDNAINQEELEEEIKEYIDELNLNGKLEEKISTISIHWENIQLPESSNNAEESEGAGSGDAEESKGTESDSSSGSIAEYSISLSEDSSDTVDGILDLFQLDYESDEINNVIQICFVDRLQDVHQGQMARLDDAQNVLFQNMNDYENKLESYDPMAYIREADLGTYLDNIENNARGMLDEVEQNNYEYRTYAEEVYYATSEHTSQLIDSLNTANTQTTANIESCIDELISSRQELNSRNVDMLEGFTEALAYTRVGSQGNVEVYDYIINPVVSRTTGEVLPVTDVTDTRNEISIRTLLVILLGIGIAACLAVILFTIRVRYKKPKKEK